MAQQRENLDDKVKRYREQMKKALIAYLYGNREPFDQLKKDWPKLHEELSLLNPLAEAAGIHKAITGMVDIPIEHRRKAKDWLIQHKFKSEDDGDL